VSNRIRANQGISRARVAVLALAGVIGATLPLESASAQGIFDFLFGGGMRRHQPAPHAYAPSSPPPAPVSRGDAPGAPISQVPSGDTGRAVAFCVRTCDGRYFPLQRVSGTSPAEVCRSFCPSAQTKVYNGSVIDHAVASDGTRYNGLKTAFLYRKQLVADCTCNGKSPMGLARIDAKADPTLRPGDIVATKDGLQAYAGSRHGGFTPVASYSALAKSTRDQLSMVKITPAPASLAPAPAAEATTAPAETTGAAPRDDRRAQLAR
jgi:hypothetical protein